MNIIGGMNEQQSGMGIGLIIGLVIAAAVYMHFSSQVTAVKS